MQVSEQFTITALVISLVALTISIGSITQQYFSTAEGYRRCQESVIGAWASLRRSRWRWSEMRYETRFCAPEIRLLDDTQTQAPHTVVRHWSWRRGIHYDRGKRDMEVPWFVPVFRRRLAEIRYAQQVDFDIMDASEKAPRPMKQTVWREPGQARRGTDLVTWTELLQSLHDYQKKAMLPLEVDPDHVTKSDARVKIRLKEWVRSTHVSFSCLPRDRLTV